MNEFKLIKKYFYNLGKKNKASLKLNDDVFFDKKKGLVISVDTYVVGKHFPNFNNPDMVIKKIIRSSISDLICKGVKPKYYFLSGSGNSKSFTKKKLSKIIKSLKQEEKKYNILLGGGDTVSSNKISFTVTTIGFSNKIIYRNKVKPNDDIYVTGNIGDSYLGLLVLTNKIKLNSFYKNYFINQYYMPNIKISLHPIIKNIANSSIDISDGLFADLNKLINIQKLPYKVYLDKIPLSNNLKKVLKTKKLLRRNFISKGDDYEILFTADRSKRRIIYNISKKINEPITRIGKILKKGSNSSFVDQIGRKIKLKSLGYVHNF